MPYDDERNEDREFFESPDWLEQAIHDDPSGAVCGFCGGPNHFADDCGFFYLSPNLGEPSLPACEACYDGEPGQKHRAHYGVGER